MHTHHEKVTDVFTMYTTSRRRKWESDCYFTLIAIKSSDRKVFNVQESIDFLLQTVNEKMKQTSNQQRRYNDDD